MALPVMPPTTDRAPFSDDPAYEGMFESNVDWASENDEAISWLADNHAAIRARLEGALTEGQIKALDWMLTVLIEQTAERAPGMQPDQAVEEICDITSIVELLPPGEVHSRLMPQCEEIRREHQVRLDQVLAEEAKPKVGVNFEIDGHGDGEEFPDLATAGTRIAEWVANLDPSQGATDYRISIELLKED